LYYEATGEVVGKYNAGLPKFSLNQQSLDEVDGVRKACLPKL